MSKELLSEYSTRNTALVAAKDGTECRVIISAEPLLSLGSASGVGSNYDGQSVAIFAESIALTDNFFANKVSLASHSLVIAPGKAFNLSGAGGQNSNIALSPGQSYDGQDGHDLFLYQESADTDRMLSLESCGGNGGDAKIAATATKAEIGRAHV